LSYCLLALKETGGERLKMVEQVHGEELVLIQVRP